MYQTFLSLPKQLLWGSLLLLQLSPLHYVQAHGHLAIPQLTRLSAWGLLCLMSQLPLLPIEMVSCYCQRGWVWNQLWSKCMDCSECFSLGGLNRETNLPRVGSTQRCGGGRNTQCCLFASCWWVNLSSSSSFCCCCCHHYHHPLLRLELNFSILLT